MLRPMAIKHYLSLMQDKGISTEAILERSDIEYSKLDHSSYFIEPRQYRVVVGNMLKLDPSNGIGFDVGWRFKFPEMGAFGHALMTCKTFNECIFLWRRYRDRLVGVSVGLEFIIYEDGEDDVVIEYPNTENKNSIFQFQVEEALGMLQSMDKPFVGKKTAIKRISLGYPPPLYKHRYFEYFQCPVNFNESRTSITLDRDWFFSSMKTRDDEFNQVCLKYCEQILARIEGNESICSRLQNFFGRSDVLPSLEGAAEALNLSVRTLRRRLDEEDTTFSAQLQIFRMERATEYLMYGYLSIKVIADLLWFGEASAFRHAFKKWTGQSLSEYRKASESAYD